MQVDTGAGDIEREFVASTRDVHALPANFVAGWRFGGHLWSGVVNTGGRDKNGPVVVPLPRRRKTVTVLDMDMGIGIDTAGGSCTTVSANSRSELGEMVESGDDDSSSVNASFSVDPISGSDESEDDDGDAETTHNGIIRQETVSKIVIPMELIPVWSEKYTYLTLPTNKRVVESPVGGDRYNDCHCSKGHDSFLPFYRCITH